LAKGRAWIDCGGKILRLAIILFNVGGTGSTDRGAGFGANRH
jgi:hypothetical protein